MSDAILLSGVYAGPDERDETRAMLHRIAVMREGGQVERCHTLKHVGTYDVAQHSYGVIQLIFCACSNPSVELIRAAAQHDIAERWTGDVPAPAKKSYADFALSYARLEEHVETYYDLHVPLTMEERRWLRAADIMELWLWAKEQSQGLGNRYAELIIKNIDRWIRTDPESILPLPLRRVWEEYQWFQITEYPPPMG